MINSFRDLEVYQKAYKCSFELHQISLDFPQHEKHELGSQIRRATKSIALNIAEGFGKNDTLPEFKRFLKMAQGSCDEVRSQLDYCKDLKYITKEQHGMFENEYISIGKMLTRMSQTWQKFN